MFFSKITKCYKNEKDAEITGWFLRGMYPIIGLNTLKTKEESIKGFVKLGGIITGVSLIAAGVILLVLSLFLSFYL